MIHYVTPNDLLRFIYRETSAEEEARIKTELTENPRLALEFHQLMQAVQLLDGCSMEPSETSVNVILDYSKESIEEESHA
jgi:hypothetical protein